jgi:hypothetical protein
MVQAVADFETNDFAAGMGRHSEHQKIAQLDRLTLIAPDNRRVEPKSGFFHPSNRTSLSNDGSTGFREAGPPWRG